MEYPDQSSLHDMVQVISRGLLPAAIAGLVLGGALFWLAERAPASYEAEAALLVVNSNTSPGSFDVSLVTAPRIDAAAYRAAIFSGPVLDEALRFLGVVDPNLAQQRDLAESTGVDVTVMDESSVIAIRTTALSPELAASRANALTQAVLAWDQRRASRTLSTVMQTLEAQIVALDEQIANLQQSGAPQAQIDVLQAQRNDLSSQLNSARALMTSAVGRLEILDPAPLPEEPVSDRSGLLGVAGFLVGLFVVYAFLIVRNALDTRIRSIGTFAGVTGVPVITGFEPPRKQVHRIDAETANYLRAHVMHATANVRPVVVVVTSPFADENRPKVAVGLAVSMARSGLRTLLVDANLRDASISGDLQIAQGGSPDLETYLLDPDAPFEPAHMATGTETELAIVPSSGPVRSPSELLDRSFAARLQTWRESFDAIVIETPPVLDVADVLSVAPHATGILLVADLRKLRRAEARQAVDALRHVGTPILGAAVSGADDDREGARRSEEARRRPAPAGTGIGARRAG